MIFFFLKYKVGILFCSEGVSICAHFVHLTKPTAKCEGPACLLLEGGVLEIKKSHSSYSQPVILNKQQQQQQVQVPERGTTVGDTILCNEVC